MAEIETAAVSVVNGGPALGGFSKGKLVELLRQMLLYRRFEEKAEEAYAIGKIGGFCHLHIGQEGAAAGCILPLRQDDYVISSYRSHTQALAKGLSPEAVMSELYGKAGGTSGGAGGSMHIFGADVGFMGGNGIVGAQAPLALGMAWAIHYRGGDQVCVCFLGDAAVNQGAFHESMNMAAIWNLPVIYVVENNAYGMGTKFTRDVRYRDGEEGGFAWCARHGRRRGGRHGHLCPLRRPHRECSTGRWPPVRRCRMLPVQGPFDVRSGVRHLSVEGGGRRPDRERGSDLHFSGIACSQRTSSRARNSRRSMRK